MTQLSLPSAEPPRPPAAPPRPPRLDPRARRWRRQLARFARAALADIPRARSWPLDSMVGALAENLAAASATSPEVAAPSRWRSLPRSLDLSLVRLVDARVSRAGLAPTLAEALHHAPLAALDAVEEAIASTLTS